MTRSEMRLIFGASFAVFFALSNVLGVVFVLTGYAQTARVALMVVALITLAAALAFCLTFPASPARADELPAELDYVDWDAPAVQPEPDSPHMAVAA